MLMSIQDILGPKWNKNKQGKSPCPTLVVWVPKKEGFTEFVEVNKQSKVQGGFSIAIFCYALELLPFKVQPIFKPFINDKGESNGTYDQLLMHIEGKTCQAAAGDITILGNRTLYVDFTIPYLSSEVYMLVRAAHGWNQTLWTFLKPFTMRLWISLVAAYILTGVAIAFLEYRVGNPEFASPSFYNKQTIVVIWFPISAFFFPEGKILNNHSTVVLILWFCMIFIVVQIFTATLASWLTLDQLRPKPSSFESVGYPLNSYLKEFIMQHNSPFRNLVPLRTVDVVIHELAYIELFLAKYGSDYIKIGPIIHESGLAFAFPIGSPLLLIFSRAVIKVTESEFMMNMTKKYLGFHPQDKLHASQDHPERLDVHGFIGLFIFMGVVTIVTIISSEFFHNNKIKPDKEQEDMGSLDLSELEMQNKTLKIGYSIRMS